MDDKVKVLLQIEIPRLNEDVDIASIRKILNEYVKSLIPRINIQDLKDWSLLIWVAYRSTNWNRRFLNEQDVTLQIKNLKFRFLLLSQMIIRFRMVFPK